MKRSVHSPSALHETREPEETLTNNLFLLEMMRKTYKQRPLIQIHFDFKFLSEIFTEY